MTTRPASSEVATDSYIAAKASLRDNVKTLVAVFGGVAGVVLAGAPFTGYGSLDLFTDRWWVASIALVLSLVLLGWCVQVLLYVLRPDLAYTHLLIDKSEDPEIVAVQSEFEAHKRDLLPRVREDDKNSPQIDSIKQLVELKSQAWGIYQHDKTNADNKAAYDRLADALALVNHWSGFTRLHKRVAHGLQRVFWIGLGAILSIATFALASAGKKDRDATSPTVFVIAPSAAVSAASAIQASSLPPLQPVLFATGKSDLTPEAVKRIGAARDYLRAHANTGVLVFANTDTVGGHVVNQTLALRRAESVAKLLRSEGGISPSRIFVTSLAKSDLPALTVEQTEREANRSVEMILIPLPARGS
jgi:outer membrane protein OmpA-like peptidoglycan-associated protein